MEEAVEMQPLVVESEHKVWFNSVVVIDKY